MKKTYTILITMMLAFMLALTGCSSNDNNTSSEQSKGSSQAEKTTLPTEDRAGNAVTIPTEINKIVSLAPAITQVLETLDVMDKVVAVDTTSPTYVKGIENLPQIDMMKPDIEALIALEPDIVYVSGISFGESDNPFKALKDAGICVVTIPTSQSIAAIKEDNQFIADSLGMHKEGQAINENMQKEIDRIAEIGKTITDKKTVLFEISALPNIYSFGSGVFLNEMLETIGAKNVLADQESWLPVTEEAAVDANPDVILTSVNYIEDPVGEILGRSGWKEVTAVKNKAVYAIDNGSSSLPNHHIVNALKQMAKVIYPEAYESIEDPFAK